MLRPYFLHHRELLGGLAHAAWETVLELMCAAAGDAAEAFDPAEFVARVIMHITEHDVVDAILRHLAKTKARSPRGPPGAVTLPGTS